MYVYWFYEYQGTLKSLLQCHSSKASILWGSAFFTVQLLHPFMTTGKTISFIVQSLSNVWLFVTPCSAAHQAPLSFTTPWACSNSSPLSQWCHPTISSSAIPFSSCLPSFPASESSQWVDSSVAKVLELQLQHQSFQWIFRVYFL